jgi:hypothetical protein
LSAIAHKDIVGLQISMREARPWTYSMANANLIATLSRLLAIFGHFDQQLDPFSIVSRNSIERKQIASVPDQIRVVLRRPFHEQPA